ncbi:MAG TPA: Rrf2 family transcriptional regulator [Gemmataceae bacterium]|nr:Rrf2 family transcriptional regulator [Gemmataceae bacterium]
MMKLTRASLYALHAVTYMAAQKDREGGSVASHVIAQDRGIPERFLLKVLKPLVAAQILISVKGPNGGYRLARPAKEISMLEIVEAVDGQIRGSVPFDDFNEFAKRSRDQGSELSAEQLRKQYDRIQVLHKRLEQVCTPTAEQLRKLLERVKISELAAKG